MRKPKLLVLGSLVIALLTGLSSSVQAQSDVTQPGDTIIPSSANSPGSEAVANAIDNQPTKYLNFDSGRNNIYIPSGFVVTPAVGRTHVTGIAMQSANDAPERDPRAITLEGSNDDVISAFNSGNWEVITAISNIPSWQTVFGATNRFRTQTFTFANPKAFRHYRWVVVETQTTPNGCCMQIAEVELLGTTLPNDVTQPGDVIFASSGNSPGSEAVANAIDNQPTKYLNFDSGRNNIFIPSGFAVSPSIGRTLVTGVSMQSANDAPERDPRAITLEGSNDPILTGYNSGTWEVITAISNIPPWATVFGPTNRFKTQTFLFDNPKPYRHYRWVVVETQTTPNGCCMQIAEVELLGTSAPRDVTQPGDPIIPSSGNSPGSEAVANAIDDQPTKYLNFDSGRNNIFIPSGFAVSPRVGPTTVIGITMQSANDAPERDPRAITLEGSNDDTLTGFNTGNWEPITAISGIPSWASVFGPTNRFRTQEFFFLNKKSYKHYRWIVTETQTTPNGCCMQIAEVELLAVPSAGNTNEIDTLIRRQPKDTPVLLGAQATFRVLLTGPWNVQWYKNGVAIPGAVNASYTTPAATQGDDGALFKAVVSSAQGTQVSDEVMLSIFTPSTTESIGLSFRGFGANGAPTDMFPTDITGFHQQAYWNNLGGVNSGSGALASPINSSNLPNPTVTVNWATSGEWGVGTGNQDPTERMLNGMVTTFGTSEGSAQTVTFSGVPAGTHSLLIYTVQVPLEFFNMNFQVVTFNSDGTEKASQLRFIRPQNADEYNPSPGFILVSAETAANRSVGNMIRFDNLQSDDGRIQIRFYSPGRAQPPGSEPIRGPGVNGLQLLLNPGPVPASPVITRNPVSENGIVGGTVTLTVEAIGAGLSYQWLKNGLPIDGATGTELVLSNLQPSDEGNYRVAVSNPAGRILSRIAFVDVLDTDQITEDLIVHFKFDELGEMVVSNSAPGGVNGEVRGTSFDAVFGQIDNGLSFNGTDTYVYVPNYTKPSNALTVSGWISLTAEQASAIVNNWVAGQAVGSRGQFFIDLAAGPTLNGTIAVGPNFPSGAGAVGGLIDTWHHYAMSVNGTTLNVYFDGELLASADYLGNINSTLFPWLVIGADYNGDAGNPIASRFFSGGMDDLAMWARSLSGAEIRAIYQGGLSGQGVSDIPPIISNLPPLAGADTIGTPEDTQVTIPVLANDSDPDMDPLSVQSATAPANGSVVINTNGTITYIPALNFNGTDSFRYTVIDGAGGSASALVTVTVSPAPDAPIAGADAANTAEDTPATISVLANDLDPDGDTITLNGVGAPSHGTAVANANGTVTYTPAANYNGTDSFAYTISDGQGGTGTGTVTVNITPVNDAPVAVADSATAPSGGSANINVLANDSDIDGDALSVVAVTQGAHGSVSINANNTVAYTANAGYLGPDSFNYSVSDGNGGIASTVVQVNVIEGGRPPQDCLARVFPTDCVISNGTSQLVMSLEGEDVCVGLAGSATDPDGDPLTFTWIVDGTNAAAGALASVCLELGCHQITMVVSDGRSSCSTTMEVCVVTGDEAVAVCVVLVDETPTSRNKRPLIATLKSAMAALAEGRVEAAMGQLGAFQNKVRAQYGTSDPAAAALFLECSQKIVDAVGCASGE